VLGFGLGLPEGDYNPGVVGDAKNDEALEEDVANQFWRFIYLFPLLVNLLMLLSFKKFFDLEPIMYSVSLENDNEALSMIEKVYGEGQDPNAILNDLKTQCLRVKDKGPSDMREEEESGWD